MKDDLLNVIFSQEQISERVAQLGNQIAQEYAGKNPLLIGILKGCFIFFADLVRNIDLKCEIRFILASSYGFSSISSGNVKIGTELDFEIAGRDVIIIEDILDSGLTLKYLSRNLKSRGPLSVEVATLLLKKEKQKADIECKYVGSVCPDEFVVGYGLDYSERYRHLPYIGVLDPKVYA